MTGYSFTLQVGQQATVSGEDLVVKLTEVTNDSRCPTDVTCVWAGTAEVHIQATKAGRDTASLQLSTPPGSPNTSEYLHYRITLTDVKPAPRSGTTIPQPDNRATLVVTAQ